jgi:Xaa-Pro aminopeptidase
MSTEKIKNRIGAVRDRLKKQRLKSLLITKPASVTYITGFLGDSSWALVIGRAVYLLTDSRYTEQARAQCRGCKIIQCKATAAAELARLLKKYKSLRTLAVEDTASLAAFESLKKHVRVRLKTVAGIVESVRTIKDKSEIAAVTEAARIAAKALKQTLKYIKPGIAESELAGRLDFQIRKAGADSSFPTIVAFGPHASRPHHQPTRRKLRKNDTLLIDFGVRHNGYCCDITRCFTVGRPNPFYKRAYNAVQEAQAAAIKIIKPGVMVKEVDAAARKVISKHDLPVYGHGTGHGIGLEVHERPVISPAGKAELQPGMLFTIEPAVYIPGKLGIRIEDDVLVTKTGYEILTKVFG